MILHRRSTKSTTKVNLFTFQRVIVLLLIIAVALNFSILSIIRGKEDNLVSPATNVISLDNRMLKALYDAWEIVERYDAPERVWEDVLLKGVDEMEKNGYKKHLTIIEVGAHSAKQSLIAAEKKFHTYTIEPSPPSFDRIVRQMKNALKDNNSIGEFIHMYNAAAGKESGLVLDFKSTGGTGDHVGGEYNVWEMKIGADAENMPEKKKGKIFKVPSMKLDDIIYYNKAKPNFVAGLESGSNPPDIDNAWAIKVDTQGFEPKVFEGMKESIKHQKIKYILTEYWPNGMGLLNNDMDKKCELAVNILNTLTSAGYTLFALPLVVHPAGRSKEVNDAIFRWEQRPLHDAKADCQYMLDLEKRFPNPEYKLGYWTDIFAIAPGAEPILPQAIGKKRKNIKRNGG